MVTPLRGDRAWQYYIRINDQYLICFPWRDGEAYEVEIAGYHCEARKLVVLPLSPEAVNS